MFPTFVVCGISIQVLQCALALTVEKQQTEPRRKNNRTELAADIGLTTYAGHVRFVGTCITNQLRETGGLLPISNPGLT